jgi:adenylylsulfate kinase-like enzyme
MYRKILIMGLPGAGKTTLATILAARLNATHADEVRRHINKGIGFSAADRIEQARRMGCLCDQLIKTGCFALADFICPTPQTRRAFTENGPGRSHREERVRGHQPMFVPPESCDVHVTAEASAEGRSR